LRCARGKLSVHTVPEAASAAIVSVVIPAFNHASYVGDALDSVHAQTYARWECVVVDDGSEDDTRVIVEDHARRDARIRYARQANAGLSAARNAGLRLTTGDLVQLLDADDVLGPRKLEQQVTIFAENPEADLVYGDSRCFGSPIAARLPRSDEWLPQPARPTPSGSGLTVVATLLNDNIMVVEAPLIRRSLINRVGEFDPELRAMEDWDLWLRCAREGATFLFDSSEDPRSYAYVRVHGTNMSSDTLRMLRSKLAIRYRLAADLEDSGLIRLNRRRINEDLARMGVVEGARGNLAMGMRSLVRAGWAGRDVKWLAMGITLPALRLPLVQRGIRAMRTRRSRAERL
jgi:glycosyltransferase involved in cell wall biosynthesis